MRRSRVTITLSKPLLNKIDKVVDGKSIRNRSHAIEFILTQHLQTEVSTAVILAGGQGTRLRPLTYELPKALLPIQGKPLLEYILENCKANNVTNIIICTGYLGEKIKQHFGDGKHMGLSITYSQEKEPSKTGGALLKIKSRLNKTPFLVINGDIVTTFSFADLIEFHKDQQTVGSVALTAVQNPQLYGQLKLHGSKLVSFYQGKAPVQSYLVNAGIYVFEPTIFDYFPKGKDAFLLEDTIQKLIQTNKMSGFVFEQEWFDVGSPENYERAIKGFSPKRIFK